MSYPPDLSKRLLIFDVETRGLVPELGGTTFCVAAKWRGEKEIKFFDFRRSQDPPQFVEMLNQAEGVINQNVKFDIRNIVRTLGLDPQPFLRGMPIYDTLIMAKHAWPERGTGAYSLDALLPKVAGLPPKDIAKQWLKQNAPKGHKRNYELLPREVLIPYACADTVRAEIIFEQANKVLGRWDDHVRLDHEMLPLVLEMELAGVGISEKQILTVEETMQLQLQQLRRLIPFPIEGKGSRLELIDKFAGACERWGFMRDTKRGPAHVIDNEALKFFAAKGVEWAAEIMQVRYAAKMLNGFIQGWKKFLPLGRLYPSYNIYGARTGRMSSQNPNFQQVPKRSGGGIMRRCIVPDEGKVFVLADFAQMEDFGAAYLSGDANLLEACQTGDVHADAARRIFGATDKLRREVGKTCNHATKYGASAKRIQSTLNSTTDRLWKLEECREILQKYWGSFPSLERWLDTNRRFAAKGIPVRDPFGRRQYAAKMRPYAINNYLIQGWCSTIMKRSALRAYRHGLKPWLLLHDEIGVQCNLRDAPEVGKILMASMVEHEGYRFPAEASLARKNWDDKTPLGDMR